MAENRADNVVDEALPAAPAGTISRTLHLLRVLGRAPGQTLTEVSKASGLSTPTALRFLRALEEDGFAKRDATGAWRLTTVLWQLGCAAIDYDHTGREALDVLAEVVEHTKETAVYALYEDGHTTYVEQVSGPHALRTHIALGSRVRATATATGRCALAYQPAGEIDRVLERFHAGDGPAAAEELRQGFAAVRAEGWAFNRDGLWRGVWGLAAPVADRHGRVIGAIGVSGPAHRQPPDLSELARAVRAGADRLTTVHGGVPVPARP